MKLLSEEEYLRAGFDNPEPDYLEGVLVKRSMPGLSHSRAMSNILLALMPWDDELTARPELTLRILPRRYRPMTVMTTSSEN